MSKRLVILAIALMLPLAAAIPASAATFFHLRFSPASANWTGTSFGDIPSTWSQQMWGATVLWTPPSTPWGVRFNVDSGGISNYCSLPPGCGFPDTGGSWTMYDISVAYVSPLATGGRLAGFVGYGNSTLTVEGPAYGYSRQIASGLIFGADFYQPIGTDWYTKASATFGSGQRFTYESGSPGTFLGTPGTATTSIYSVSIGRMLGPGTAVELGWRNGGFSGTGTGSAADGTNVRWTGVVIGLTIVR